MKTKITLAFIAPLAFAVACRDATSPGTQADGGKLFSEPLLRLAVSGCGGQTELLDSRATLEWASRTEVGGASGITSDGGGAYSGGTQGVQAKLFYHDAGCSRSGDVVFDPDKTVYKPARTLTFYFPVNSIGLSTAGVKSGAYMTLSALMQLGSDVTWDPGVPVGRDAKIDAKYPGAIRGLEYPETSAVRPGYPASNLPTPKFRIQYTGIAGCETLEYDGIRSTRTAGGASFLQLEGQRSSYDSAPLGEWAATRDGIWVVESLATGAAGEHHAQCFVTRKGILVTNGGKMHIPFRVLITEGQP